MKKILHKLLLTLTVVMTVSSCSESLMDKINKNENEPADVPARFILTDAIIRSAMNTSADLSFFASVYMEHEVGISNQLYNAEKRATEVTSSLTYENNWNRLYMNLEACRIMIAKCSTGEEKGNNSTLGYAKILSAYNLATLTDCFGDAPFSEMGDPLNIKQPKIEKQEKLYESIFKFLDEAIENINNEDVHPNSDETTPQDILYKFDESNEKQNWIKFAKGLKARYMLRLAKVRGNADYYGEIINLVGESFKESSEEAKLTIFNNKDQISPFSEFFWDRNYFATSQSFMDRLTERNDPRAEELITPVTVWQKIYKEPLFNGGAAPNGTASQSQYFYAASIKSTDGREPLMLLSYHELLFIKAEAMLRRGDDKSLVAPLLKEAVRVSAKKIADSYNYVVGKSKINDAAMDGYFDNVIADRFNAEPLKELMNQKYLSCYGNGEVLEAYHDYRRCKAMGDNFVTLANPLNDNKFPLRFTYGASDVTTNAEVRAAYGDGQYVYTENVWWAGGTR